MVANVASCGLALEQPVAINKAEKKRLHHLVEYKLLVLLGGLVAWRVMDMTGDTLKSAKVSCVNFYFPYAH